MTRLKFERLNRGWSLQTLAHHAEMAAPEVSKIERGLLVPYTSQRLKLARVLEIDPQVLLAEVRILAPQVVF